MLLSQIFKNIEADRGSGVFAPSSILHIGILWLGILPISIFQIFYSIILKSLTLVVSS